VTPARAIVTGGAGFIGGHLVAALAAQGVAVTSIDRRRVTRDLPAGAREVTLDLRDAERTRAAVTEAGPEVVYHLAAQASVAVSMREPREDIETNVLATVELARAAADAGCRRFVFVSSGGAMYGQPEALPAPETAPVEPESIYGASKAAAELYLAVVGRQTGMEVAVVRPSNVYGPWQDPHGEAGVVAIFSQRMLRGEPVTIFGDGTQTRDYVYVGDVVAAVRAAADAPVPATCNVCTGVETSTQRIFDELARFAAYERAPVYGPERPGDIAKIALDPARAFAAWGWRPAVALEDGLRETVDWFRSRQG
jgi:UDP-glucose 4-epimerase